MSRVLSRAYGSSQTNRLKALLFPGQGFQKLGMLIPFHKKYPGIVEPILEELDESLKERISVALINEAGVSGPDKESVNLTSNAQPLLLAAGYAIYKILEASQPHVQYGYFLGHSLGEYTAWTAAGILQFYDSAWIVRQRGKSMEAATDLFHSKTNKQTGMTLVMLPPAGTEHLHKNVLATSLLTSAVEQNKLVDIGNINSKSQIVLSGVKDEIKLLIEQLNSTSEFIENKIRLRTRDLTVSGPFHSQIMTPGQETMQSILDTTLATAANRSPLTWHWPPKTPIISNITANPFQTLDEVQASVVDTLTKTVQWSDSIQYANSNGCKTFVSLGPGRIGKQTATELSPGSDTVYIDTPESIDEVHL
ncbi:[acyl-carrier-protein] S-malonyltransferase [Sugiyamaella lignohabitans]|uniref:[acyl-carrier-protein] S-malonyltransferase n=1 Tax=Sugiyamaella lignohabitans TaxID=796027 RepID=A0A167DC01_9ASCO|nr:[acyl-carrier-protein] S-malonyltransferase [Sugiyamaella lignohabitans]ANB12740.1 [acyl-carrier-protein] S-malonyltransferase [Sugiyamaella lignohabitans]